MQAPMRCKAVMPKTLNDMIDHHQVKTNKHLSSHEVIMKAINHVLLIIAKKGLDYFLTPDKERLRPGDDLSKAKLVPVSQRPFLRAASCLMKVVQRLLLFRLQVL